jgi:hypothetical protein
VVVLDVEESQPEKRVEGVDAGEFVVGEVELDELLASLEGLYYGVGLLIGCGSVRCL